MANRILSAVGISGMLIGVTLFALRYQQVIGAYGRMSSFSMWLFFWSFAVGVVCTSIWLTRLVYGKTRKLHIAVRILLASLVFIVSFGAGAFFWLAGCLGMNFMGQ